MAWFNTLHISPLFQSMQNTHLQTKNLNLIKNKITMKFFLNASFFSGRAPGVAVVRDKLRLRANMANDMAPSGQTPTTTSFWELLPNMLAKFSRHFSRSRMAHRSSEIGQLPRIRHLKMCPPQPDGSSGQKLWNKTNPIVIRLESWAPEGVRWTS